PGTVNGSNQCEVTVDAAKEAIATFDMGLTRLTVNKDGGGTGTVTSAPAGIECGGDCDGEYEEGEIVTLTGASGPNTKPAVWGGCDSIVGANQCEVTMSADRSVTATFEPEQHLLKVSRNGTGTGTVTSAPAGITCGGPTPTCQADFDHAALVKLS